MPGGTSRTTYPTKSRRRQTNQIDFMRRVRREFGQGHLAWLRVDLPPRLDQPTYTQDRTAIIIIHRGGNRGFIYAPASRE